ncbi:hypothetical protein O9G_004933 [Rozella allomycis CSF55]|uniref:Protein YOP1 n=1 Tax=Rozella allomycis (strain CSF55) TaxID=988480 RepID=A0A075AMQ3_ROZAC|nr:hypothetical protein O9G_004933 [Rozella allomycis CSF55]|eukprot:EPZ30964.1 hypothetical protein O9G_004933 [Rozella allomycis CSF55]
MALFYTLEVVYPAVKSIISLQTNDIMLVKPWLQYWILYGFVHCFPINAASLFVSTIMRWIFRIAWDLWLVEMNGHVTVFEYLVEPYVLPWAPFFIDITNCKQILNKYVEQFNLDTYWDKLANFNDTLVTFVQTSFRRHKVD